MKINTLEKVLEVELRTGFINENKVFKVKIFLINI